MMQALRRTGLLLSLMLSLFLAGGMPASGQTVCLTTLHTFRNNEGWYPTDLIRDADGNRYVTTQAGSVLFWGTIWKISSDGAFTNFYTFSGWDGNDPSSLVLGTDGNFYGTTYRGGTNSSGTVFRLSSSGALTMLYSFGSVLSQNPDGINPEGLFQGQDGNFYGYAPGGGSNDDGTIFQITPAGTLTVLHTFNHNNSDSNASHPSGLTQGTDGNFYGTTRQGGIGPGYYGTVFKLTLDGTYTTLHAFTGTDGHTPWYLMRASDGSFYGCTRYYPTDSSTFPDRGTIFKITPDGTFTSLYAFQGPDGVDPTWLIQGLDGNFYGTATTGGYRTGGNGTIFTLTPAGEMNLLFRFGGGTDGARPLTLVQTPDGSFDGITSDYTYVDGKEQFGTVYHFETNVPYIPGDFNGDSHPDLLFTNPATGQLALWYLLNGQKDGVVAVTPTQDPHWQAVAVTTLQVDQHPDVLFYNSYSGRMALWFMNNSFATDGLYISPTQDSDWKPVAMADFNSDGHPDILFQHRGTGQLALWYMNRNYLVSAAYVYPVQDSAWQVVGTGDFNGDGHPDILFQNRSTGQMVVWYMADSNYAVDGAYVTPIPDAGWQAVGVADYDGDGHADILLQNTSTRQLTIWTMNNVTLLSQTVLTQVPDAAWKIVGPR